MRYFIFMILTVFLVSSCASGKADYVKTAEVSIEKENYEDALKHYESHIKRSVHSQYYYASLADIHYSFGYYGKAVNEYTRALRISGKAEYNLKRGRAYMNLGFYRDAVIDFTRAAEKSGSKMPIA